MSKPRTMQRWSEETIKVNRARGGAGGICEKRRDVVQGRDE